MNHESNGAGEPWLAPLDGCTAGGLDTAVISARLSGRPATPLTATPLTDTAWPTVVPWRPDVVRPVQPAPVSGALALQAGLSNGEIAVSYQPVVALADRRFLMVEALARWQRPHAPVSPTTFVPLAENCGLVRALSVLVASTAAAEIAPLRQALKLRVSVNLPLALLLQPDLPGWLGRSLRGTGLRPRQMSIELTETTEVHDLPGLRRALLRLRNAGHPVLLDDLMLRDVRAGLLELPFAGCKLDRSLVEALPDSAQARNEARLLLRLAERRGQTVIAEGVADQRLWAVVRHLGVHAAQGFGIGRPMPASELPRWAAKWRSRPTIRSLTASGCTSSDS